MKNVQKQKPPAVRATGGSVLDSQNPDTRVRAAKAKESRFTTRDSHRGAEAVKGVLRKEDHPYEAQTLSWPWL